MDDIRKNISFFWRWRERWCYSLAIGERFWMIKIDYVSHSTSSHHKSQRRIQFKARLKMVEYCHALWMLFSIAETKSKTKALSWYCLSDNGRGSCWGSYSYGYHPCRRGRKCACKIINFASLCSFDKIIGKPLSKDNSLVSHNIGK